VWDFRSTPAETRHGTSPGAFLLGGDRVKGSRPKQPTAVGEVLRAYLARTAFGRRLDQATVVVTWPALVGPQVAAVTRAESVGPDGTLFVRVATSPWMNELQLMTPDILARVNAGRGSGRVRGIRWLLSL